MVGPSNRTATLGGRARAEGGTRSRGSGRAGRSSRGREAARERERKGTVEKSTGARPWPSRGTRPAQGAYRGSGGRWGVRGMGEQGRSAELGPAPGLGATSRERARHAGEEEARLLEPGDNDGWGGGKNLCPNENDDWRRKEKIWTGGGGDGIFPPFYFYNPFSNVFLAH
jgi:hypothetical protein